MFEKLNQQNLDNPREIDKSLLEKIKKQGKSFPLGQIQAKKLIFLLMNLIK